MASTKAYGKISEAEQAMLDARRCTRKRTIVISLSSIVLVAIGVAAVVGTSVHANNMSSGKPRPLSTSVKAVCDVTLYKDSCLSSLAPRANSSGQVRPGDLFKLSIQVALEELAKAAGYFSEQGTIFNNTMVNETASSALESCRELLGLALDHLNSSLSSSDASNVLSSGDDLRTWLSAAGTCQQTCIDGFDESAGAIKENVASYLKNSGELISNSLAIITWISSITSSFKLRRLMSMPHPSHHLGHHLGHHKVPKWVHRKERELLQSSDLRKKANAVVAKDGSGKYKTIGAALNAVPDKSNNTFVIYVKKGVYSENVRVEKSKWNVMMVGDGMDATLVTGSLNFIDGTPTFKTATFAVFGQGFIARDMGFRNTAGPAKHQAVALMSTADRSIFYRCRIDAFQDSLYAHSNRQFYRDCNIYGTIDFIFGNSAVVFQNCNILPRTPMLGQQNTITAQGKIDPNQNTGISIQNCTIWPAGNLTNVQTFLGRPWKNYSTTVYMRSMMSDIISPNGWLPWVGNSAPDTIYYAELQNYGPGSNTKSRVKWNGLKLNLSTNEASKFTVKSFIKGDKWIKLANVTYNPNL
ncbi:probable pectinesterase/pectinesterase inhibitor 46 [Eucalyptus grandis]|uniref:probable pectinesterase/pectinesterase inhibitor 46 n=1 Tax=Eucalyptus grandis TaxID=71139 RepID=UPI00192EE171|nr:probable pectinesterase/pectinesterase inhibitor 46 [Eucalyptus grandis]